MSVYIVKNSPCVNKSIFFSIFGLQCYASFRCFTKWFSYTESPYIWTFKLHTFKDVAMCSINFRCEWNRGLLSISYCWWSSSPTISHLFSLLQPVPLLACSLDASPVCQLLCCTTVVFKIVYFKIKNAFFIFCIRFLCYLCKKYCKHITYCTICLLILTDYVCWLSACSVMPNSLQPYGL